MTYKTILVHMADPKMQPALLDTAIALARQNGAHLLGLCVLPSIIIVPGSDGGPAIVIEEQRTAFRAVMAQLRAGFEAATKGQPLQTEWCEADARYDPVVAVLIDHGRTSDLIVAAQADAEGASYNQLEQPERLIFESGRPVLLVPQNGRNTAPAKRIVLAWNGSREAARATFDALPLLKQADEVVVLWVDPQKDGDAAGDLPGVDICRALARHGVRCGTTQNIRPAADVGSALLDAMKSQGAQLLVMGCYGHSRLREFVFGGATRHVLQHMDVPVLMSH